VTNPQVNQLCSFKQVYSMILSIKLSEYLYEIATGENRVGSKWRGREREKESDRLEECETHYWTEMEMACVGNGQ
jgi:hypothetical protein